MKNHFHLKCKGLGLYFIAMFNLLLMHYYILIKCRLEEATDTLLWIDNLLGIVCDLTIILLLSLFVTRRKQLLSLYLTNIVTLSWSFSNILYSRFFHHYISLSAIEQVGNLADSFMLRNIIERFQWTDGYFLIILILTTWIYNSSRKNENIFKYASILIKWPIMILSLNLVFHVIFCILTPGLHSFSYLRHRIYVRHFELLHSSAEPNWASFHRGAVRQIIIPYIYQTFSNTELTEEQRENIKKEYSDHKRRLSNSTKKVRNKNIIFIIVESYLSVTSDLTINGREITPFLNSLKRDSTIYFNGNVKPNITIGESSDGQFLYMTGLLPLRSEVTVTKAKYSELPGLPKLLKQDNIIKEAQMIIPTLPSMWEQESMCEKYGFDHLYSSADYQNGRYWYLSDRQIFKYAIEKHRSSYQPFLSVILTMTMHQPYNTTIDSTFIINDNSLTEKYRNYLNVCHYTDEQIRFYFEELKKEGLYDNSLIVIVADHHAHPSLFDMKEEDFPIDIPLYIINGNINNSTAWQGECNQLDVYTTLLDIVGITTLWKGFGNTLINLDYSNSIRPELWSMSENIILGNYFRERAGFN